jgi:hypothetical protein
LGGIKITEYQRIGADGQFETGPMSILIEPGANLEAIKAELAPSMAPAQERDIVKALTRLALTTAHQTEWSAAKLSAYSDILAEYPGDAVMDTLTNWHKRGSKWFPTVPELVEVIEIKARRRLRVKAAIQRAEAKATMAKIREGGA